MTDTLTLVSALIKAQNEIDNAHKDAKNPFFKNDYANDKTALSIIHLYQKLLQRYPDKDGFNYFYSKISNNELTIQGLEDIINQSTEYTHFSPIKLG